MLDKWWERTVEIVMVRKRGNKGRIWECLSLYIFIYTLWREWGDKRSNLVRQENNKNRCSWLKILLLIRLTKGERYGGMKWREIEKIKEGFGSAFPLYMYWYSLERGGIKDAILWGERIMKTDVLDFKMLHPTRLINSEREDIGGKKNVFIICFEHVL